MIFSPEGYKDSKQTREMHWESTQRPSDNSNLCGTFTFLPIHLDLTSALSRPYSSPHAPRLSSRSRHVSLLRVVVYTLPLKLRRPEKHSGTACLPRCDLVTRIRRFLVILISPCPHRFTFGRTLAGSLILGSNLLICTSQ